MKGGYEMIGSDANGESKGEEGSRHGASMSTRKKVGIGGIGAVAVLGILLVVRIFMGHAPPSEEEASLPPVILLMPQTKNIPVRPVCQSHGKRTPKIIQTSMKAPDQQWAGIACLVEEQTSLFEKNKENEDYLNTYGLPDAILQVNFSQIAHPDRNISILGFGGAFTEAASLNFKRLPKLGQDTVMELLFGKTGLGYTIGRFPINSCDFSVKSYSFDETKDDFELHDFDTGVHHDVESGMVGMAKQAVSTLQTSWGTEDGQDGSMFLYASPWSPPAWMKKPTWEDLKENKNATTAQKMTYSAHPNCLKEGVGPDSRYAKTWALYFSKFLTAYKNLGLPLQAITVQNEPEFAAPWEACSYTPKTQRDFISNHLGPQLAQDHPNVKIMVFDHNKDHVNKWADTLLSATSLAKSYIAGTAYHWYAGGT
jgi:hypothetical protein